MDSSAATPTGWRSYTPEANYTITLLAFAWTFLPLGFMVMLLVFNKYDEYQYPLALFSLLALSTVCATAITQRPSSMREGRIQLALSSLTIALIFLMLSWGLDLQNWWWVSYAFVFGSTAMVYVAMSFLAGCTGAGICKAWNPQHAVTSAALPDWVLTQGIWKEGEMAWKKTPEGVLCILSGRRFQGNPHLCFEVFTPGVSQPVEYLGAVQWHNLRITKRAQTEEE